MSRILFYGDSPNVDTGFGRVSKSLLARFHTMGYEVNLLGINWYGDAYDTKEYPYKMWPCDKGPADLIYGYRKFWEIEEQIKPDIIFVLNDPWVAERLLQFKPKRWAREGYTRSIIYYPVDAGPIKESWIKLLSNEFDAQICYSHYAEDVVIESNRGVRPKNLYQVYHGVDTNLFRPLNQQSVRNALNLPLDSFIVGMVARNQYRKRFDILVKAFAEFAKDKENAKLYLHTATQDVGFDIVNLADQFNLGNKLILTEDVTPAKGVPDSQLNLIYNSFDVNCLISLGDGFGLPVAESMATACPQIVSDHSCLRELVAGHGGETVKTATMLLNSSGINTWGYVSDVDDLTLKLNLLYNDKALRIKHSEDAFTFIHQPQFSWDYAAEKISEVFKKTLKIYDKEAA